MAISAPTDDWTGLADLLANLIAKYAPVLDLDEPTPPPDTTLVTNLQGSPNTGASLYFGVAHIEAV